MILSIQEKTRLIGFMSSNRSNPEHGFSYQPVYREKGREVIKDFGDWTFPHSLLLIKFCANTLYTLLGNQVKPHPLKGVASR